MRARCSLLCPRTLWERAAPLGDAGAVGGITANIVLSVKGPHDYLTETVRTYKLAAPRHLGILPAMGAKSRDRLYGTSVRTAAEPAAWGLKEADKLACDAGPEQVIGVHSGDSAPPFQDSNSAATTSNPHTRTGRTSASLETTGEAGKSPTGEPLRNRLPAKQRSSPTRPRWVQACASPDPLPQRVETPLRADNMLPRRPRVKLMRACRADLRADGEICASLGGLGMRYRVGDHARLC